MAGPVVAVPLQLVMESTVSTGGRDGPGTMLIASVAWRGQAEIGGNEEGKLLGSKFPGPMSVSTKVIFGGGLAETGKVGDM